MIMVGILGECLVLNLVVVLWYLCVYCDWVWFGMILYGVLLMGVVWYIVDMLLLVVMMLISKIIGV